MIHILLTQKWAVPFPCSKTKSKISFSLGWAQEGLIVVPYVTTYAIPLRRRLRMYIIVEFIGVENIFVWYFFGIYFMNTALLAMIHILRTQKWASGYSQTLLFERRTEQRYVYKWYGFYTPYICLNVKTNYCICFIVV